MVFVLETKRELDLVKLRDVFLESLVALNKDGETDLRFKPTDFKVKPIEPKLIGLKNEYMVYLLEKFAYNFNKDGFPMDFDSLLAYRVYSPSFISKNLISLLEKERVEPDWVLVPGFGDTMPGLVKGVFYQNPSNKNKRDCLSIGRNLKSKVPNIDELGYCWNDLKGAHLKIVSNNQ